MSNCSYLSNGEKRADKVAVISKHLGMKIEETHVPPSEHSADKNHISPFQKEKIKLFSPSWKEKTLRAPPDFSAKRDLPTEADAPVASLDEYVRRSSPPNSKTAPLSE
jgi:hypothetical protein